MVSTKRLFLTFTLMIPVAFFCASLTAVEVSILLLPGQDQSISGMFSLSSTRYGASIQGLCVEVNHPQNYAIRISPSVVSLS